MGRVFRYPVSKKHSGETRDLRKEGPLFPERIAPPIATKMNVVLMTR
jgi:hypothetical protein